MDTDRAASVEHQLGHRIETYLARTEAVEVGKEFGTVECACFAVVLDV